MRSSTRAVLAATLATLVPAGALAQGAGKPARPKPPAPAAKAAAGRDPVQAMIDGKALAAAYNPVLVSFLSEEGRARLSERQRKAALDQLVARFKQEIQIAPAERATAALATVAGALSGGAVGEGLREGAGSVWASWVDAALVLQRAGYGADTVPFFENCIKEFPDEFLRARCAAGLAAAAPEKAVANLLALLDSKNGEDVNNMALRLLGATAGSELCPPEQKTAILDELVKRSKGMMNAVYSQAVVDGLAAAHDERAVEPLRGMTKGMTREGAVKDAALRALALVYQDKGALEQLQKNLKGGFGKNDADKVRAALVLIEAGHPAGFEFAQKELSKKKGGLKGAFSPNGPDYSAVLVRTLVDHGGEKARPVLSAGVAAHKPHEWITSYMAIGLLVLGDRSQVELVRQALANEEWTSTRLRAAEALAGADDLSGVPVLAGMAKPHTGLKAVVDFATDRALDAESLRVEVAASLGRIDKPAGVPVLVSMLADPAARVRTRAAWALADMKDPAALDGMAKALAGEFGKDGGRARTPEVHAYVLRRALAQFPKDPRTRALVDKASSSSFASVKFLALVGRP